jgi:hypothetical protein
MEAAEEKEKKMKLLKSFDHRYFVRHFGSFMWQLANAVAILHTDLKLG